MDVNNVPTSVDATSSAHSQLQQPGAFSERGNSTAGIAADSYAGASEAEVERMYPGDEGDEDAFEEYGLDDELAEDSEDRRVDEQEMYSTLELIAEKPKDVVQYLEEEGELEQGVSETGCG